MSELSHPVAIGQVIAGKYRVERVIGSGGMGVVVAAQHLGLGKVVALKFLLKHACESRDAVSRFLREGRALAQITSAHVARVMDVGTLEQGEPYLVLEYLEGSDLSALLKERGQLPVSEAVDYILQACEAVAEAHATGIIHRDLKPSNLFLTRGADGGALIKVLDFGIAKAIGPQPEAVHYSAEPNAATTPAAQDTNTGALVGSPLYMSPEQIRSARRVDERTDIWGFGVTLYELLCAHRPFTGETLAGTLAAVAADPPTPMTELRPGTPPELEQIVLRCLEKSPDKRFGSIAGLAQALRPFAPPEARASVERIERVLAGSGRHVGEASAKDAGQLSSEERAATVPTWEGKTAPLGPSAPGRRNRLAIGLILGAAAGVALVFLRPAPHVSPVSSAVPSQPADAAPPVVSAALVAAPAASAAAPPTASAPPPPSASSPLAASSSRVSRPGPPPVTKPNRPSTNQPAQATPAAAPSGAPKSPQGSQDGTADRL